MPTIAAEKLTRFAARLLKTGGLSTEEVALVSENLVAANLRGYDSHGVMRIPQYLEQIRKGEIVPGAQFEVVHETPAALTVNGNWGFGMAQAGRMMRRLIEKARTVGVAVGTMAQCAHAGRLGNYCEMAIESGTIGMAMVNNHGAARRVAPPGGTAPRLGTNPIAVGIPNGSEPLVMDFCTCMAAEGKVRVKRIAGETCPDGWLLDNQGRPTNDPADLYADPPGTIRPIGGSQPYKGFALSLMVEIFSGALSGGLCAREVPKTPLGNCVFMMVLAPEHFGGKDHFDGEVSDLVKFVRDCPMVEGVDEITLPGDPERHIVEKKLAEGICLDEGNFSKLTELAEQLGVELPG